MVGPIPSSPSPENSKKVRGGSAGPGDHADYLNQEPNAAGHKDQNAKENSEEACSCDRGRRLAPLRGHYNERSYGDQNADANGDQNRVPRNLCRGGAREQMLLLLGQVRAEGRAKKIEGATAVRLLRPLN